LLQFVLFTLIVVSGTGGELCVSRAMKQVGEAERFSPSAIAQFVCRALRIRWMWLGVSMMALAFFALLGALTIYNVSFVVPVTALSYGAGAIGSAVFLREHVSPTRWLGVGVVTLGVLLVFLGSK